MPSKLNSDQQEQYLWRHLMRLAKILNYNQSKCSAISYLKPLNDTGKPQLFISDNDFINESGHDRNEDRAITTAAHGVYYVHQVLTKISHLVKIMIRPNHLKML
jgi:hypothetical protein